MKERKQVTIGIHRDKYDSLSQRKAALEETLGRRVDWGTYFLTLASQRSTQEIAFGIRYSEILGKPDAEVDYDALTSLVTKEDMEEAINKAVEKIINELKQHLYSRADKWAGKDDEETQPKEYWSKPLEA